MQARPHARTYTHTYTRTHARLLPEIFQAQNVSTFLLLVYITDFHDWAKKKGTSVHSPAKSFARGQGCWGLNNAFTRLECVRGFIF